MCLMFFFNNIPVFKIPFFSGMLKGIVFAQMLAIQESKRFRGDK